MEAKIAAFAANPMGRHGWAKALAGVTGVRIRHGDWRAICEIRDETLTVTVVKVGHRREIYR